MNQIISQNPGPFALIYKMSIYYLGENDLPIKYVFCDITTPTVPNLTCIMEMYHVVRVILSLCSWNVCYRKNRDFSALFNRPINIKIII